MCAAIVVAQAAPAIACSVVSSELGPSVRFQGRIVSRDDVTGTYRLAIAKAGPSGRSAINQSGRFSASRQIEAFVGSTTIGIERGAEYSARLTVEVGDQTYTCESNAGAKP